MIEIKHKIAIIIPIILCLMLLSFGAYKYVEDRKNITAMKEDIDIEIISEGRELAEESIEEEVDEEKMETDAEELEITKEEKEESVEEAESEEVAEAEMGMPAALLPPLKTRDDPDELRIGFITDLHVRSISDKTGKWVLKPDFTAKINYFIEKMNNDFVPNFILSNGDIIEGTNASSEKGMAELALVKKLFDRTVLEKYWTVGNHDLRSVDKKQFMQALEIDYVNKAFEVGNYKIITLDSNFRADSSNIVPGKGYTRGYVSKKQVDFLKRELKNTDKRTLVFLHHPPLWNIDGKSNSGLLENSPELMEIFSQKKVFAVFAGHIEDLFFQEIDGVKYFISPGMIKNEKYQGTFSEITIKKGKIVIDMNYLKKDGTYRTVRIKED